MPKEQWVPAPNPWHESHEISDRGRVKSKKRQSKNRWGGTNPVPEKILSQHPDKDGYMRVWLHVDGTKTNAYVNRLVCEAFHGPPPFEGAQASHLDGTRTKNTPENLQWETSAENHARRVEHGTSAKGAGNPKAKLTEAQVAEIKWWLVDRKKTQKALAQEFGVSEHAISDISRGRNWTWVEAKQPEGSNG